MLSWDLFSFQDAFWALVQICEKYLTGYYSVGLEAVQIDGMVLAGLMKKESPITHKHMVRGHRRVGPLTVVHLLDGNENSG